jgi:hypothetical protein
MDYEDSHNNVFTDEELGQLALEDERGVGALLEFMLAHNPRSQRLRLHARTTDRSAFDERVSSSFRQCAHECARGAHWDE